MTIKSRGSDQVNIVVDRGRLKFHFLSINAINLLYVDREPVERHDAFESPVCLHLQKRVLEAEIYAKWRNGMRDNQSYKWRTYDVSSVSSR